MKPLRFKDGLCSLSFLYLDLFLYSFYPIYHSPPQPTIIVFILYSQKTHTAAVHLLNHSLWYRVAWFCCLHASLRAMHGTLSMQLQTHIKFAAADLWVVSRDEQQLLLLSSNPTKDKHFHLTSPSPAEGYKIILNILFWCYRSVCWHVRFFWRTLPWDEL